MPKTSEVVGNLDGEDVRLVVQEPTVLTGMRRAILTGRALDAVEALGEVDDGVGSIALMLVARYTYPDVIAATVDADGLDVENLSLADFMNLPQLLVDAWLVAVYEICPHWRPNWQPQTEEESEAEKKEEPKPDSG